jgi:hypothetical protein
MPWLVFSVLTVDCVFVCFSLSCVSFGIWLLTGECWCLGWGWVRKEGRWRSTGEAGAQQGDGKGRGRGYKMVLDDDRCCRRGQKGRAVQEGKQTGRVDSSFHQRQSLRV